MRTLINNCEAWTGFNSDVEEPRFSHTVTVWKEEDAYYQTSHGARQGSYNLEDLPQPSTPMDLKLFKAAWNDTLTECPNSHNDCYHKSPTIFFPEEDRDDPKKPGDDMAEEAKVYEILKHHPHPNIAVYNGCVLDDDRLHFHALCLKKYPRSLSDAITRGVDPTEHNRLVLGIRSGLQHLHGLGLVHNDVNPTNIMLDEGENPIIVDFDSCQPLGEELGKYRKAGTFFWTPEPGPTHSLPDNDEYGLNLIAEALGKKVTISKPQNP